MKAKNPNSPPAKLYNSAQSYNNIDTVEFYYRVNKVMNFLLFSAGLCWITFIWKVIQKNNLEVVSKIVDYTQGQGANRFKSGAYTLVFEHFESV